LSLKIWQLLCGSVDQLYRTQWLVIFFFFQKCATVNICNRKMPVVYYFETVVLKYRTTQCHNPTDRSTNFRSWILPKNHYMPL
jgi:hypothetical protein